MIAVRAARTAAYLTLALLVAACRPADDAVPGAPPGLLPLTIETADGAEHLYHVEVARGAAEQAEGLMYRQSMARDRGMLFPFETPRQASFWMKNTYLPLDMIFVGEGGRIESIAANTVPLSTDPYRSLGPVAAVLELNAGEAARIGAAPGDEVRYTLADLPAGGG